MANNIRGLTDSSDGHPDEEDGGGLPDEVAGPGRKEIKLLLLILEDLSGYEERHADEERGSLVLVIV